MKRPVHRDKWEKMWLTILMSAIVASSVYWASKLLGLLLPQKG